METSTKWKCISSKNASKIEVNQNAEVKVITVAPRRPNPSSTSDSKRGLNTIPTYSKRSHLDAQRCRTNCMIVAVISGLFFSGLFAVWACCQMTIQEALTPKSICKGPVHPGRFAYNSLLTLEDSMDIFTQLVHHKCECTQL